MKKKASLIIALGYIAVIVFTFSAILIFGRTFNVYVDNPFNSEKYRIEYNNEGIVELKDVSFERDTVRFCFRSLKKGKVTVTAFVIDEQNELNYSAQYLSFTVLPTGVIYLTGYDYGGYQFVLLGMALITLLTFAVCLIRFKNRIKSDFYSYKTILDLALVFFCGLQSIIYFVLFIGTFVFPDRLEGWQVYNFSGFIMTAIFLLSIPLLVIFAGFMSFSNVSLIRHEGFGRNNLFGILISLALFVGALACAYTAIKNPNSTGLSVSEIKYAVNRTVVSGTFVYSECLLLATQICTFYAAKRKPSYDKDFIIILGCKIRSDGTPYQLLKGRIDRAIDFYSQQLEKSGKKANFIPSGGKGNDEVISEAESIKNYLVEHGIEEENIYPETESATTLENMLYSKAVADSVKKDSNILFSTTNYHIFRSGMFSVKAGLRADGIGAKTKWYFWPNAQIREFIGLLFSEWKINLLFVLIMVSLSVLFANIPSLIDLIAG